MSIVRTSSTAAHPQTDEYSQLRLAASRGLSMVSGGITRLPNILRTLLTPLSVTAEGLMLGILRPNDMEEMVKRSYLRKPDFYDPKRYQLPHEERLLPSLEELQGTGTLLDAFCGQGREARLFARAGYQVIGIDRMPEMIEGARRYAANEGFQAQFMEADFMSYSSPIAFDIVYTSCWMYSTVQGCRARHQFLQQCRNLCSADGYIVLSYISGKSNGQSRLRFVIARTTAHLTAGNRDTESGERIENGLFWHHLKEQQVESELAAAGLETVCILPGQDTDPTFRILRIRKAQNG